MNEGRRLRIAHRIHRLLLRQLGQGIDVKRMLNEPLYARDVLLICGAEPASDLDSLARHFRAASSEPMDANGLPSTFGGDSTGFGSTTLPGELPQPAARPWFSPARWLGR